MRVISGGLTTALQAASIRRCAGVLLQLDGGNVAWTDDHEDRVHAGITFAADGALEGVSDTSFGIGLTVSQITISLSGIVTSARNILSSRLRRRLVRVFDIVINTADNTVLGADPRFFGAIEQVEDRDNVPDAAIIITVDSHAVMGTRTSTSTRSDADQRLRNANDGFFKHVTRGDDLAGVWGAPEPKAKKNGNGGSRD